MTKPITTAAGFSGLNTVDDPVRIAFVRGAVSDLQVAVNVSIDQSGRANRRLGSTTMQTGAYHSIFCDDADAFVVSGDSLYRINGDDTLTLIKDGLTNGKRMAFVQVGDRTYYTNGFEKGIILEAVNHDWSVGTYTGVETHKQFVGPPTGSHLATYKGRMYIAQGKVLWWSEPFNFDIYNQAAAFAQFFDDITMIVAVDDGLFVSTTKKTYFLGGVDPAAFTLRTVAQYPALEWSNATEKVDASQIGFEGGLCAVWASREGAVLGFPTGQVVNLNKNKVIYPSDVTEGFGCLRGYNFIHGMR